MNIYSSNVIDAIKTIAKKEIEKIKFDKTDIAVILQVVNADTGEYLIDYKNNAITAFANDVTKVYKVNENVLIKIPSGDLSNKIIIEGAETNSSISALAIEDSRNSFIDIGENFLSYYDNIKEKYSVTKDKYECSVLENGKIIENSEFIQNTNQCGYIRVSANFETHLAKQPTENKNYGLKIVFLTIDGSEASIEFDTSNFYGSLYSFSSASPQSEIYPIKENYITGIKSITFFADKDLFSEYPIDSEKNIDTDIIFCSDLSIVFLKKKDETGYFAQIKQDGLNLNAALNYKGENVIDETVDDITWYKWTVEGWSKISTNLIFEIGDGENDELQRIYKLEIFHNNKIYFDQINIIKKDVTIPTIAEENGVLSLSNDNKGIWYYQDSSMESCKKINENLSNSVSIDFSYSGNLIIYCHVNENYFISYKVKTVPIISTDDVSVTFTGLDMFKYDAENVIPYETSKIEQLLIPSIVWKDNVKANYSVNWFLGDTSLNSNEFSAEDSMLANVFVDSSNILHYNIKQRYKVENMNNTLSLRIKTIDKEYEFKKTIMFTKDGALGTNGTPYVLVVTTDKNYINASNLNDKIELTPTVYKDGEITMDTVLYSYEVSDNLNISINNDKATIQIKNSTKDSPYYCKVTATIDNIKLHFYVSIDVLKNYNDLDSPANFFVNYLPISYQYNEKGLNPVNYNREIDCMLGTSGIKSIESVVSPFFTINNKNINLENNISQLSPDKYIGAIKIIFNNEAYIIHTLFAYLNYYTNPDLNDWDGVSIKVNNSGDTLYGAQLGAGIKNEDNLFTGFLIGKNKDNSVGIYGYNAGESTFKLDEKGTAHFGTERSGITIDGEKSVIQGNSMTINLKNDENNKAISFNNSNFSLDYNGCLIANNATLNSGKIGGWTIKDDNLVHQASGACLYGDIEHGGILDVSQIRLKQGKLCDLGEFTSVVGTEVVGLHSIKNSLVIESGKNVRLTGNKIYLDGNVYLDNNVSLDDYIRNIVNSMIGGE